MMKWNVQLLILIVINQNVNAEFDGKKYASNPELFYMDNFDRCMLLGDKALYCNIQYELEPVDPKNVSEVWKSIQDISSVETNFRHDYLRHYICIPHTCPNISGSDENDPVLKKGIEDCYNEKYKNYDLKGTITRMTCQTNVAKYPVDWLDLFVGFIFVTYIIFVIYATFYEHIASYKSPEEYDKIMSSCMGKIMAACAIGKNWHRLKTIKNTPEVDKLRSIQGIRFYNSAIVVMTHSVMLFLATPMSNTRFPETIPGSAESIFFASGQLCMTTFYFITAFLLSNDLFEFLKDKKGLDFKHGLIIFAVRLYRLVPMTLIIVLFHATWLRHSGSGPHWDKFIMTEYKNCRKNGWTNILFINTDVNPDEMCLQTTWFSARSMQHFIASLFLISLLKKYEKYFWWIIGASLSFNIVYTFAENYYYDFSSLLLLNPEEFYDMGRLFASDQIKYQLQSFPGNMAGTIVGIAYGYFYYKHRTETPEVKYFNTKIRLIFWWVYNLGVGLGCVVVPGVVILMYSNEHNAFWASFYVAFSKPLFSIFLAILLHGFTEKIGWIAYKICCWPPTYVLGRLTLSVYLSQMFILLLKGSLLRYPEYISEVTLLYSFSGDLVLTYLAATFLTIFFELPLSAFQKHVFGPSEASQDKKQSNIKNE